jgi:hypothetical protein
MRQQLLDAFDPLIERHERQQALIAERAKSVTFKQVAEMYLDLHLDSFKNVKHQRQWRSTLATYAYPKIGHMAVAEIGPADVLRVVEPLWPKGKNGTGASRRSSVSARSGRGANRNRSGRERAPAQSDVRQCRGQV